MLYDHIFKSTKISIDELLYTSTSKTGGTITIAGVSSNRDTLVAFLKSLEDTKAFKTVDLPISNLAKNKNINFSINMTIES